MKDRKEKKTKLELKKITVTKLDHLNLSEVRGGNNGEGGDKTILTQTVEKTFD